MVEAFSALISDPAYGGQYLSLTPGSPFALTPDEYKARVAAHQMFKDMSGDSYLEAAGISADWPYGRGMYISADENFLVWVGEEDHMRVMAMHRGGSLGGLFGRLRVGLDRIEKIGPDFARSPSYGYVTSCPTNLGAGMRASIHLPLAAADRQRPQHRQCQSDCQGAWTVRPWCRRRTYRGRCRRHRRHLAKRPSDGHRSRNPHPAFRWYQGPVGDGKGNRSLIRPKL